MSDKKKELESKIEELESSLNNLKNQLHQMEMEEQHDAIDSLDEYLAVVDNKWENLRAFWPVVLKELRELLSTGGSSKE